MSNLKRVYGAKGPLPYMERIYCNPDAITSGAFIVEHYSMHEYINSLGSFVQVILNDIEEEDKSILSIS